MPGSRIDSRSTSTSNVQRSPSWVKSASNKSNVTSPSFDLMPAATVVNNLGTLLKKEGDLAGAKAHYERALAMLKETYGPEHPQLTTTLSNLSDVLEELGDKAGARFYAERAFSIDKTVYGPQHPTIISEVENLGRLQPLWAGHGACANGAAWCRNARASWPSVTTDR